MTKRKIMRKDVHNLNEHERINLLRSVGMNQEALCYLIEKFQNLQIEFSKYCNEYKGNIIDLMKQGVLKGWCWQTTEVVAVFLEDNDYIERGYLKFSPSRNYYHSFICFKFNNKIYVFDPCLQILVEKFLYYHVFEITEISGTVTAKAVKDELIDKINHNEKKSYTILIGSTDVNAPIYLSPIGCTVIMENGTINSLIANYCNI